MAIRKVSPISENDYIGRKQEVFMSLFLRMENSFRS